MKNLSYSLGSNWTVTSVIRSCWKPRYHYRGNGIMYFDSYEPLRLWVQFMPSEYLEFFIYYYRALGVVSHTTYKQHLYFSEDSLGSTHLGSNLLRSSWSINCTSLVHTFFLDKGKPLCHHRGSGKDVFRRLAQAHPQEVDICMHILIICMYALW